MIVSGMIVQAAAFPAALVLISRPLVAGLASAALLGIGIAMAQPALSVAVADHTHPSWRAQGLGVYRFWRDLGYAVGAVIAGLLAQSLGLSAAVGAGGALTFGSALLAARWITSTPSQRPAAVGAGSREGVVTRSRTRGQPVGQVWARLARAAAASISSDCCTCARAPGRQAPSQTRGPDRNEGFLSRRRRQAGHGPGPCPPWAASSNHIPACRHLPRASSRSASQACPG